MFFNFFFFFSSRRRHTRLQGDWSSDVCSSDLAAGREEQGQRERDEPLVQRERDDARDHDSRLPRAVARDARAARARVRGAAGGAGGGSGRRCQTRGGARVATGAPARSGGAPASAIGGVPATTRRESGTVVGACSAAAVAQTRRTTSS